MRRLPIYFLIDVSESMVGDPIKQVEKGINTIVEDLRMDPYALETVFVSVITFAGKAKKMSPLTELYKFSPPILPIGGGTSLGNAVDFLMNDIDLSINKTSLEQKGDWKPIIFLFTDGMPTDNPNASFKKWNEKYRNHCNLVAVSLGNNVDTQMLGTITEDVLRLNETDEDSFKRFFKWVTASIKTTSVSVSNSVGDQFVLAPLENHKIEKVDISENCEVDEKFIVILGKCQTTKKTYLIKYAKDKTNCDSKSFSFFKKQPFKLVGAYPVDEEVYVSLSDNSQEQRKINTDVLSGPPECPCCGNSNGFVLCTCGKIFCAGSEDISQCPWCGTEGKLNNVSSLLVNKTKG